MRLGWVLGAALLGLAVSEERSPWTEVMEMDLTDKLRKQVEALKSSEMAEQLLTALPILSKLSPENIKAYIANRDVATIAWLEATISTLFRDSVSSACLSDMLQFLAASGLLAGATAATQNCYRDYADAPTKLCNCVETQGGALAVNNSWVLSVLDAQGKPPPGILQGNLWFLGSYEQCREVDVVDLSHSHWEGQYCVASLATYATPRPAEACHWAPDPNATTTQSTTNHTTTAQTTKAPAPAPKRACSGSIVLKQGVCVPNTCTEQDLHSIFIGSLAAIGAAEGFCDVSVECKGPQSMDGDWWAIVTLAFCFGTFALMILSSLYDLTVYRPQVPSTSSAKEAKAYYEAQPALVRVLISFSVPRNIDKVMDTHKRPGQIECLMGIRFISLTWVILGHTYYWALPTLDNPLVAFSLPKEILNQIILNASFCVDAFYIIGGCLLTYLWFKGMEDTKGRHIRSPGFWVMFYIHRFIRLTPVYMVVLALDATLYKYAADGPLWSQTGLDAEFCKDSWWTNLLYINNLVNLDKMCMSWTWYLANDFQFYLFAPVLLVTLWYYEIIGFVLGGAICLLSGIAQAAQSVPKDWPPISIFSADPDQFEIADAYWKAVYVKPWIRCRPYVIGMLLGYILYKRRSQGDRARKVPSWASWLLWGCAAASALGVLFGLYDFSRYARITTAGKILYAVFGRTLWALAVSWLIFACHNGQGGLVNRFLSWGGFMPLAKVTYCAYLVHPLFVHGYYSSRRNALHFGSQYQMIMYFFGHVMVSYAAAFVLCLAFEIPVLGLEEIIFPKQKPRPKKATDGADQTLIPNGNGQASTLPSNAVDNPNYAEGRTGEAQTLSERRNGPPLQDLQPPPPELPGMELIRPGMTSPLRPKGGADETATPPAPTSPNRS